jgi:hypothetical protein
MMGLIPSPGGAEMVGSEIRTGSMGFEAEILTVLGVLRGPLDKQSSV